MFSILGWYKTQDGPLCCADGLPIRSAGLDYVYRIMGLTRYRCSDEMRCPDRAQVTVAEVPNPPGRDFVNALSTSPGTSKTRTTMPSPSFFSCRFSPGPRTKNGSPARPTDDTGSPPPAILVVGLNITRNINGVLMHTQPSIGMPFARCGRQLTTGASNLGSLPATLTEPRTIAIRQSNQST